MERRGVVLPTHFAYIGKVSVLVMNFRVCVSDFAECIRVWAGGKDCSDRLHGQPSGYSLQALFCGKSVWIDIGAIWLTWCRECLREVFLA